MTCYPKFFLMAILASVSLGGCEVPYPTPYYHDATYDVTRNPYYDPLFFDPYPVYPGFYDYYPIRHRHHR